MVNKIYPSVHTCSYSFHVIAVRTGLKYTFITQPDLLSSGNLSLSSKMTEITKYS